MSIRGRRVVPVRRFLGAGVALTVMAGALLVAPAAAVAATGTTITLYNGQHEQTTDALVTAFEKKTGITVKVRNNDEDTFADQIVAEGNHSPADVIFTENSPVLEYLQNRQLLSSVAPGTLAKTPSKYNSPQGKWVGVSARVSVLDYNTSALKKSALPTSVMQLANPKWKGKIGLAGSETDFQPIVTSIARRYGQAAALKWLNAVKANAGSHLYPDNETLSLEVNRGQVALGVINQYYWYRLQAQLGKSAMHSAIAYFAPRDVGYVIDVSGAAVLRSSTHQAAAQQFLAFLVSVQGQQIISKSDSFEYPIASGVTTSQPETPFAALKPSSISIAQLGDGSTAIRLLQKAQLL